MNPLSLSPSRSPASLSLASFSPKPKLQRHELFPAGREAHGIQRVRSTRTTLSRTPRRTLRSAPAADSGVMGWCLGLGVGGWGLGVGGWQLGGQVPGVE